MYANLATTPTMEIAIKILGQIPDVLLTRISMESIAVAYQDTFKFAELHAKNVQVKSSGTDNNAAMLINFLAKVTIFGIMILTLVRLSDKDAGKMNFGMA